MVWSGLGVNHKSTANLVSDAAYFQSIGLNKIRVHLAGDSAGIAMWRGVAQQWYDLGFYAMHGVATTGQTLTATTWTTQAALITAEANAIAALSAPRISEFQIGNEYELAVDGTTLTQAQLRTNLRALAVTIKAILPTIPVSYTTSFYQDYASWASEGIGTLDYLGLNVYGNILSGGVNWQRTYSVGLATIIPAIGASKLKITEFNLDASNTNFQNIPSDKQALYMRDMQSFIKLSGIPSAYYYNYRGYQDQDNQFAVALNTGGFIPMWDPLYSNNKRKTLALI